LAAGVSQRFAQHRDGLAADRSLRDNLVIFSRAGRLGHVIGHVFCDRQGAHIDIDVDTDIDNGESIAFCFSRCRVVYTCGQQQVPP
jgi:hypothetical protein